MKKIGLLIALTFFLAACQNKTSSDKQTSKTNTKSAQTYKCLTDYTENYAGLLTQEDITAIYPIDFDEAHQELRTGSYGQHIYTWPSNREKREIEVMERKTAVPDNNTIGVKNLSLLREKDNVEEAVEKFNMAYKDLSEEELAQIKENLKKASPEVREAGERAMKTRVKMKSEFIENLGSSAWYKWNNNYGGELVVMAGHAKFTIVIKISNDPNENQKLAVKLAEKVLEKCN